MRLSSLFLSMVVSFGSIACGAAEGAVEAVGDSKTVSYKGTWQSSGPQGVVEKHPARVMLEQHASPRA